MKTVYEAANSVEAHMLQDLLKQENITSYLQGTFLTGAIGELPAAGLVRLEVEDKDYDAARTLIVEWERSNPPAPSESPVKKRPKGGISEVLSHGAFLIIGVLSAAFLFRAPLNTQGVDYNGDGILDERWIYALAGTPLETKIDRNLDGKDDYIAEYDVSGKIESAESDDDFDGKFETHYFYEQGNVARIEVDTDNDSVPNVKSHMKNGVLDYAEHLDPISGYPVRVEHYKLSRMTYADVDTNGDHVLDQRINYSPLLEILSTEPIKSVK
jgi:Putative prokaryotic signal transducing protein